ncbi:MAG TPA: cation-efflux pump [Chloroflexi bacterium]|nr:cation-efflux pump [Chloroflexota bacterium]
MTVAPRRNAAPDRAGRRKQAVALGSVFTSAFLATAKLIIGLVTGSLAVLAQAADNGLDLVTTLMTYMAVRLAERPPDEDHPYGHGKVESLSALFETALLALTCGGVAYQAVRRLIAGGAPIRYSGVAIGIMVLSIGVDLVRTTVLRRTARRYHSQALAADALNFTGDILSSGLVIAGLLFAEWGIPWADPLAAMVVAGVVLVSALRLAREAVDALLDREPADLAERVRQIVEGVDGVISCRRLRVRRAGAKSFAEVTIGVDRAAGVEAGHEVASAVEAALQSQLAPVDVVVHVEPVPRPDETPTDRIVLLAQRHGLPVHQVFVRQGADGTVVDLHCEVEGDLSLREAHALASRLEEAIRQAIPGTARVVTHIEPQRGGVVGTEADPRMRERVEAAVREAARQVEGVAGCHQVEVGYSDGHYVISLHCEIDGGASVEEAHRIASELERHLYHQIPHVRQIIVHTEPA